MIEPPTRMACAHASVKSQISTMDLGMLVCLLNDELRRQVVTVFVGWVIDSFIIVSTLYGILFPLSSFPLPSVS